MLMGKKSECKNEANEIVYTFEDDLQRPLRMVVRLYNDGVAFRYELEGLQHTSIKQDLTTYHISEGTHRWFQEWTESYENFFPLSTTGKGGKQHWGYPCLFEQNDVFSLITEAGIERINSASSLKNGQNPEDYHVFLDENTQHYSGNWKSPWRVVVIGKKQDLIASTLVTDVSAPCRLKDTSWIRPGSVSWIYWAYNHGSNDLNIIKKYVDMAKTLHLPYVLIDAEWDEMKNGATIEEALQYAKDRGLLFYIFSVGASVALKLSLRWRQSEQARAEAELGRSQAELKNLKNQINPHFLLNTLNNIYALTAFDQVKAQQAIQELSRLLRYMLYENQSDRVSLDKEVEFLKSYIALMKLRLYNDVEVKAEFDYPESQNVPVAPLIFISLVENAFKHGVCSTGNSFIHISLKANAHHLVFKCENSNTPKNESDKAPGGIGLKQVASRLQFAYLGRYKWKYGAIDGGKTYSSVIEIFDTPIEKS